ncbi:universal stress protein [Streptosporangium sp. NPDC001559]|uniref:universal stress protein n=1 Tax=Streptosporangium sp. NPDC001559 TaxID=3366187 RepID=UPI0036E910F4
MPEPAAPVVVATDGSPSATAAVRWAAADAARRALPVLIVHVVERWPYGISAFPPQGWQDAMAEAGDRVLTEAAQAATERRPGIDVTTELAGGTPADVLRERAASATELVIGGRGTGGFAGALLGSTVLRLAGHVRGAVVVVRAGQDGPGEEVVVGVDGSTDGAAALGFAFEQARLRGAVLRALCAWHVPLRTVMPESAHDVTGIQREQQRVVSERLAPWREMYPGIEVVEEVTYGHPVSALTDVSGQAALLVVGSRGLGAVGSVVLGSVSRDVLQHARCPVAVVRP